MSEQKCSPTALGNSNDAVSSYLEAIGSVPLLTPGQEQRLAKLVVAGNEASSRCAALVDDPSVSPEVVERLAETVAKGLDAKRKLIEANLRLVVSIAKRYRHRGLAFLDLIQEGNAGLVKAVERFDPERGFKLSTYATWWIRQSMSRSIADQSRAIRIPVHVYESLSRVLRTQRLMVQELGRQPQLEELAERVQMEPDKVSDLLGLNVTTMSIEPMGDALGIVELLADRPEDRPAQSADRNALAAGLRKALDGLGERDQAMISLRFGLDDGRSRSLEEVGREFGVTRERVRQLEMRALGNLRAPLIKAEIFGFLED